MITPTVHAILLFASTLLPEHLRIEKFLSAAFCISELHGITTVFLELWNFFEHNVNFKRCRCSLKCGNQSLACHLDKALYDHALSSSRVYQGRADVCVKRERRFCTGTPTIPQHNLCML